MSLWHREESRQRIELTALPISVAEGYERWAPNYDDVPNPLLAREERYLAPLLTDLSGKAVLDLACGTGRWLEKFVAHDCATCVGIDSSTAMLRVAARKPAIRQHLARATYENLPIHSAAFDVAICSFALGHFGDLGCMVRELRRVAKVGADVFVSDLHAEAYARGWRVGFRDGTTSFQIPAQARSAGQIVQAFSENGFECNRHVPLWLGEPEEPLFAKAGKSGLFADACRLPAVLVCHFKRIETAAEVRELECVYWPIEELKS